MELYIGESGHVYVYELTASGDTPRKRHIEGEAMMVVGVPLDNDRNLYVAGEATHSIVVYAPDVDGNVAPMRVIKPPREVGSLRSVALDSGGNLYVLGSDPGSGIIIVYPPGAEGNVAPMRIIRGILVSERRRLQCLAIDSQDYLYVGEGPDVRFGAPPGPGVISVLMPGASGVAKPVRRIEGTRAELMAVTAMDFDADDNLYVAEGDSVLVFRHDADGDEAPVRVISGSQTGLTNNFALAVDPAGVIYSGTAHRPPGGANVRVFAAGANGNVPPIRSITNFQAVAACMAIDKPRTPLQHGPVVEEPPANSLNLTLPVSFDWVFGRVLVGGSGWIIRPGQPPIPWPGPREWGPIPADTRAALVGLVLVELTRYLPDAATRNRVRIELLDGVQASLNQLRHSVVESPVTRAEAPKMKARMVDGLARLFGFRAKPR